MKLQIEFDSADFKSMIAAFFAEAGFQMSTVEEVRIQTLFKTAFPDNLRVNAEPSSVEIVSTPDTSIPQESLPEAVERDSVSAEPPKATFSLADLHDPTYSEDIPKIQNILTLSRSLEKAPR